MRIVAGYLSGQVFDSPSNKNTHPMSEKMRGALFNILGDIRDMSVLDAFAGSGALSFEAISRGAASVVAIDNDRQAQQSIGANIQKLGVEGAVRLISGGLAAWLSTTTTKFDIVLADPPYDNVSAPLLTSLSQRLHQGGLLVLSLPPNFRLRLSSDFTLLKTKGYGDASLSFYQLKG